MRLIHFTIVLCVLSFSLHDGSCSLIGDLIRQGIHTAAGAIKSIPKLIPTPKEIFELGKNALIGLPLELALNVFNEVCKFNSVQFTIY